MIMYKNLGSSLALFSNNINPPLIWLLSSCGVFWVLHGIYILGGERRMQSCSQNGRKGDNCAQKRSDEDGGRVEAIDDDFVWLCV
mmetsp:Transcript_30128/g.68762  ORF Transcript_30128/g.68762 Transcript_30128/m.68762 type:complete len:85 (-) Transcript_30128:445-699(-)